MPHLSFQSLTLFKQTKYNFTFSVNDPDCIVSPHPNTVLPLNLKQLFIPLPPPLSFSSHQQGISPKQYTLLVWWQMPSICRIIAGVAANRNIWGGCGNCFWAKKRLKRSACHVNTPHATASINGSHTNQQLFTLWTIFSCKNSGKCEI